MIRVTGLNHKEFIINADQIEIIEESHECIVTLINGNKYVVLESSEEIIDKIIKFKNRIVTVRIQEEQDE